MHDVKTAGPPQVRSVMAANKMNGTVIRRPMSIDSTLESQLQTVPGLAWSPCSHIWTTSLRAQQPVQVLHGDMTDLDRTDGYHSPLTSWGRSQPSILIPNRVIRPPRATRDIRTVPYDYVTVYMYIPYRRRKLAAIGLDDSTV